MGKRNNRVANGQPADAVASTGFPNFDENALNALTEKIEKGFDKTQSRGTKDAGKPSSEKSSKPRKEEKSGKAANKKEENKSSHGKKRDARGNVKDLEMKGAKKSNNIAPSDERAALLQEILALGGTEEDLDLVADAASDDEEELEKESTKVSDKSFKKDLAQFVAGLGIEGQVADDSSDGAVDEDGVGDQESEEWVDGSEAEDEDEQEEEEEVLKTSATKKVPLLKPTVEAPNSKDPNRLVCEA